MRGVTMISRLALFVILLSCHAEKTNSELFPISMQRISRRVLLLTCSRINVLAISSSSGLIVIDTHIAPCIMTEIKKRIEKEFGRKDFKYVINTHGHQDHVSGNQLFDQATIISHDLCPVFMQNFPANLSRNIYRLKKSLQESEEEWHHLSHDSDKARELAVSISARQMRLEDLQKKFKLTLPNKTFAKRLDVSCGDINLQLHYCGPAHTENDVMVFIPEERLLATGDLFTSKSSFGFSINKMTDVPRLLSSLDRACQDSVRVIVPGHGAPLCFDDLSSLRERLQEQAASFSMIESAARLLERLLSLRDPSSALVEYEKMLDCNLFEIMEDEVDVLGYRLMGRGKMTEAVKVLEWNSRSCPASANAYDSYAEALWRAGDIQNAIRNYQKSLALSPANENAKDMIEFLTIKTTPGK